MQTVNTPLINGFSDAIEKADALFRALEPSALLMRPINLRHPCIFYYGHLPAFAWNQVFNNRQGRRSTNPAFDTLFERGIDPPDTLASTLVPTRTEWPSVDQIDKYKTSVEKELFGLLDTQQLDPERDEKLNRVLHLVLEHYLMHIETFLYMVHQLPYNLKRKVDFSPQNGRKRQQLRNDPPVPNRRKFIPQGVTTLGTTYNTHDFVWCNELGVVHQQVESFEIDEYPVSNAQFLEFIEAGGYRDSRWWSDHAWQWIQAMNRRHPQFWIPDADGNWLFQGMFEVTRLQYDAPVWVSMSEAEAFARWSGGRLPSEQEFHRAAFGTFDDQETLFPWGNNAPSKEHGNFGFASLDPQPIGSHPDGASRFGVQELYGNGWEWTSTTFAPFPGFEPISTYPGYSADFFDGRHFVLKGASPVTATRFVRRSFRNWYQPHYPYMYAKFRCVYETT